jgi:hypothetical protein
MKPIKQHFEEGWAYHRYLMTERDTPPPSISTALRATILAGHSLWVVGSISVALVLVGILAYSAYTQP